MVYQVHRNTLFKYKCAPSESEIRKWRDKNTKTEKKKELMIVLYFLGNAIPVINHEGQ